ncbi:MAG: 1,4-dihydroxy-2-naphthoate octaprenyltransferase [Bacteroidales bacterium]|nr:1,4-dihydroxy-2-naphthoate octaprenyltransferase [Bacteroidales bacterium]
MRSGIIQPYQMKIGIGITALITMATGLILLLRLFHTIGLVAIVVFLIVGFFSLLAALFYTLGSRPYGYKGWGDFFAFLFFGPIAVIGTYYLQSQLIDLRSLFPSIGMGLLSSMILNVNNMRDIENDEISGKRTIAVRLGLPHARIYHTVLMITMHACFLIYSLMYASSTWFRFAYLIIYLFQLVILTQIFKKEGKELDAYLSKTALSAFLIGVLFSFCINM